MITVNVDESLDEPDVLVRRVDLDPGAGHRRPRPAAGPHADRRRLPLPQRHRSHRQGVRQPEHHCDGHPARFGGENGNESLTVYDVNGATVTIDDSALLPAGGTRALFPAVTLVPEPAAWHTHLYRVRSRARADRSGAGPHGSARTAAQRA